MYEEQFSKRLAELRTKKGVSARDLNVTPQEFFNFSEEPSNGMNALTDQLQQFDSEQINALAAFIKTIVKK